MEKWLVINGGSSFWWQRRQNRSRGAESSGIWVILPACQEALGALKLVQPSCEWMLLWQLELWGSVFLVGFTRRCKLPQAQSVKGRRGLLAEVYGDVLLGTSLDAGMRGAAAKEPSRHLPSCEATSGSVGRSGWLVVSALWVSQMWLARNAERGPSVL